MIIFAEKSLHEEKLSQPLPTNIKHFKIDVTFLFSYNSVLIITNKINISFSHLFLKVLNTM